MYLTLFRLEPSLSRMNQNPSPQRHFGEQVQARFTERNLTLREVTEATGIPLTTLHRKLRSESMAFTLGELTRIATLLGTTAGRIVTEYEGAA